MPSKSAITIDKQVQLLKSRGLIIKDESKAKEVLLDIGYYRFCSYLFPYEQSYPSKRSRTHIYQPGTTFEDALDLYYFDYDLRKLLLRYLFRIEVNVRTYITYYVSNHYASLPCWFVASSVMEARYISDFDRKFYNKLKTNNPVITEHHRHHPTHKHAPAWKTVEQMPFGNLQTLYNSILDPTVRANVALHYGVNKQDVFDSYFDAIRRIRNNCAHGSVIFDMKLPMPMMNGPAGSFNAFTNSSIIGIIEVMKFFLKQISDHRYNDFCQDIDYLLASKKNPKTIDILQRVSGFTMPKNKLICKLRFILGKKYF